MLLPRIIPCLLLTNEGLVKTTNFTNPNYIGDPINTVKIFNEKRADEIIILDIFATTSKYEPRYELIQKIAREARMPLCYGGGIKTLEQVKKIFSYGIEKIALSSILFSNKELLKKISKYVGVQSTVAILDVKKKFNKYEIFINNGKKKIDQNFIETVNYLQNNGVGEIVVNSIDKDGSMDGYDFDLIDLVYKSTSIPITILGGAGNYSDLSKVVKKFGSIGIAAGSLFVYKGSRKAVLLNYPSKTEKINFLK